MKLKSYSEYKDSGVEWIGEIPENWDATKLKFISRIETGMTPSKNDERYYSNGIFPWVKPDELNELKPIKTSKINLNMDGKALARKIPQGSILVCCIGSLGKIGIAGVELATNQQINAVIPHKDKLNPDFAKYIILSSKVEYEKFANSNVVAIINKNQQGELIYPVPSIGEQEAISNFLDKKTSEIDLAIEKDTRLIELLKEKRTALINHVVTKGLDPTVKMTDSGVEWIGEIPEDWEMKKFKRVSSKITQGPNPDLSSDVELSNYKVLKTKDLYDDGIKYDSADYLSEDAYLDCVNSRLEDRDILITIVGHGSIGKINIFESQKEHYIFTRAIALIRPLINQINPKFIKYFFESKLGKELLYSLIEGSTGQEVIKTTKLSDLRIITPHMGHQNEIIEILDIKTQNIDLTIEKIQKNIDLLEEYKKSLIHHVVTGKVDVREVAV